MIVELLNFAKISYNIIRANLYMQRFENLPGIQMDGKVSAATERLLTSTKKALVVSLLQW